MLRRIYIDGFRSLIDFEVALRSGLNVIVGANGTGKSNFISFLDFLAVLVESDLNSAIAVAQGAGAVFSKERFSGDRSVEMKFRLEGSLESFDPDDFPFFVRDGDEAKSISGDYSYSCVVSYLSSVPAVFISKESLSVDVVGAGRIEVVRSTARDDSEFKTSVDVFPEDHPRLRQMFKYSRERAKSDSVGGYLSAVLTPERSMLLYLGSEYAAFMFVANDLMKYRSVNVDPGVARRPSPVGSMVALRANGEGLAGALYHLKRKSYLPGRHTSRFMPRRSLGDDVFPSILSWCREVNPEIHDVEVRLDHMEAQLRPFMRFRHGERNEEYPFSRISDGTVKWLALATVLFAEPGLSIVEEPENFLHPFMQESFVALCRQAIERDPQRSIIISTHSPTVLDCCGPDELTMFEMQFGKTKADRIANREELAAKIARSRFGMGYYYKIGALYGENSGHS